MFTKFSQSPGLASFASISFLQSKSIGILDAVADAALCNARLILTQNALLGGCRRKLVSYVARNRYRAHLFWATI